MRRLGPAFILAQILPNSPLFPTTPSRQLPPNQTLTCFKKKHGFSGNCEITADNASRHANVFLRHTAKKGKQAPSCWCLAVIKSSAQTGSSSPPWAGEIHLYLCICNQSAADSLTAFYPVLTGQTCAWRPSARQIFAGEDQKQTYLGLLRQSNYMVEQKIFQL